MKKTLLTIICVLAVASASSALAAGDAPKPPRQAWSFDGHFGTFDRGALQRGLKVYREVCASCHSMKRIAFRNLEALGYDEGQVKAIAAEYTVVNEEPDEQGDMFERPARPSDRFPSPFANDNAAKFANNNAFPPDLSLIVKARPHGADYIYALLTGYEDPADGHHLMEGQHYNKYMPGHIIAMAPPLSDEQITYEDGTSQTVEQYSKDVTEFLAWASEPELEERKQTGIKVLIFLLIFTGVMYGIKKKTWAKLH